MVGGIVRLDEICGGAGHGVRRAVDELELDDPLLPVVLLENLEVFLFQPAYGIAVRVVGHHVDGDQLGLNFHRRRARGSLRGGGCARGRWRLRAQAYGRGKEKS